jgi:hypothetical protein
VAQSEHLPIYKAAYDLCLYLEQVVRNFSRYHKYGIGADMREAARRVLYGLRRGSGKGQPRSEEARRGAQARSDSDRSVNFRPLMRTTPPPRSISSTL